MTTISPDMVRRLFCSLLFLLCSSLMPPVIYGGNTEPPHMLASWVQYVTDGVEVRMVTTGKCPSVLLDGQPASMVQRAAPTGPHPDRVCTARVPTGTNSIQLEGMTLPAPMTTTPERIVVLGDSGCRVSAKHGLYQACNNSSIWPFKKVTDSAAQFGPELIIVTGDYIYRESPCPTGNKGCEGTPHGDNQATWLADWFQPSHSIRAAAPLVLLRGNHENCARAGHGWFRYLDAHPYTSQCQRSTAPWVMEAGTFRLAVLDTSELKDADNQPLTGLYSEQLTRVKDLLTGPGWIATHRPFWGFGADDDTGKPVELTGILQDAVRNTGLPQDVRLLIGAHLHLAEVLSFGKQRPPQLIVGNSGTQLVPETKPPEQIDGLSILNRQVFYQYGFVTMESATHNSWTITFRDINGRVIEPCLFSDNNVACASSQHSTRQRSGNIQP